MNQTDFAQQITENQQGLFAYVYSLVGNNASSWDVLQETNIVLWKKREDFKAGTNFKAWAFTVARFQVLAFIRDRKREPIDVLTPELMEVFAEDSEEIAMEYEPRLRALRECRGKLPAKSRKLLDLHYREGLSLEKAAETLAISPNAVKQALFRVRRVLQACIEQQTPNYL